MFKRIAVLTIVCSIGAVAGGADGVPVSKDVQGRFDRNNDGFLDRQEQEQLNRFLEMAERARRLRAEAEEIERNLKREFGTAERPAPMERPRAELVERTRAEIEELMRAAERAEREGREDEAAELREKAEMMAQKMEAAERGEVDRQRAELKERYGQLVKMAREAKERGEPDRAGELWAEAEEIAGILKRDPDNGAKAGPADMMRAEVNELMRAAERAEREGRKDQAAQLREKAEYIARRVKVGSQEPKTREKAELKERLRDMEAQARQAEERGQKDRARELWAEAEGLRRALERPKEQLQAGRAKKDVPRGQDLAWQVEELRNEVRIIRREVERLRELVASKK